MPLQKLYQSYSDSVGAFTPPLKYSYDAVHYNRLYRSELYAYDNLGQIKMLRRGALNADKTNVPAVNHSEAWNFDKTGNWVEYSKNGMTETRTHNAASELQGIATHDANGNMTLMPGLKGKYDAWNRLVEVKDTSDNVIATYEYNGLNQRIKKTVGGVLTKSFYNENWQEVESVTGSQMTSYVWGTRYIDDLVLREKGEERLYSLADPNWNVAALVGATGTVAERIKYDAFGKITWLDADFGAKPASGYNWNRTFTGQVLDAETGLMLYRMRYFNVDFGRFISVDPLGYEAEDKNLYRYVGNQVTNTIDPLGQQMEMMGSVFGLSSSPSEVAGMSFEQNNGKQILPKEDCIITSVKPPMWLHDSTFDIPVPTLYTPLPRVPKSALTFLTGLFGGVAYKSYKQDYGHSMVRTKVNNPSSKLVGVTCNCHYYVVQICKKTCMDTCTRKITEENTYYATRYGPTHKGKIASVSLFNSNGTHGLTVRNCACNPIPPLPEPANLCQSSK